MANCKTFPPTPVLEEILDFYWRSVMSLNERLNHEEPTPFRHGMTFNLNALAENMIFPGKRLHMNRYCYLFGQPAAPRLSVSHFSGIDILGVKFKSMGMYRLTGLSTEESRVGKGCVRTCRSRLLPDH